MRTFKIEAVAINVVFQLLVLSGIPATLSAGIGLDTSQAILSVELDPTETYRVRDLELVRGDVQFYLTDGYLIFSKPVLGAPIAAIFSSLVDGGDGEVLLLPPDRDERRILSASTGSANLDEHVADIGFFFADDTCEALLKQIKKSESVRKDPGHGMEMAAKYTAVLRRMAPQFEVRLLLDLLTGGHDRNAFFAALVGGKTLGGFDLVFDPRAPEQVLVGQTKPSSTNREFDIWASYIPKSLANLVHRPDFHADNYTIDSRIEANLHMRVETAFTINAIDRDLHALSFELSRRMEISSAEVDGRPAEIVERATEVVPGTDPGDRVFLIVPAEPLRAGTEHTVVVRHAGNVITADADQVYFVGSRGRWYPHRALEFSRFDLKFRFPKILDLVAPGDVVVDRIDGDERMVEHRVDVPLPMAGFNLGDYDCKVLNREDLTVKMCGNRNAASKEIPSASNASLAAKIVDIMEFYTEHFGPPPLKKLVVSPIPGKFGQGFGGLIYLSTMAYMKPSGVAFAQMNPQTQLFFTELMQAHEAAHQWWGNLVLTSSYHDEWLMEALANYSAMLYLHAHAGSEAVKILLDAYRDGLLEKTADGTDVEQAGPVTQARRIQLDGKPEAWVYIMYGKGTWIMQMLHARMGNGGFWKMLAELRRRYERKNLTTEEFRELCAEFMPNGVPDPKLRSFFDQWVYGMGVPRLKFTSATKGGPGALRVTGVLSQSAVSEDFSADFPVEVQYRGKKSIKWVESSSEPVSFSVAVGSRPERVDLDPGDQFLKR